MGYQVSNTNINNNKNTYNYNYNPQGKSGANYNSSTKHTFFNYSSPGNVDSFTRNNQSNGNSEDSISEKRSGVFNALATLANVGGKVINKIGALLGKYINVHQGSMGNCADLAAAISLGKGYLSKIIDKVNGGYNVKTSGGNVFVSSNDLNRYMGTNGNLNGAYGGNDPLAAAFSAAMQKRLGMAYGGHNMASVLNQLPNKKSKIYNASNITADVKDLVNKKKAAAVLAMSNHAYAVLEFLPGNRVKIQNPHNSNGRPQIVSLNNTWGLSVVKLA